MPQAKIALPCLPKFRNAAVGLFLFSLKSMDYQLWARCYRQSLIINRQFQLWGIFFVLLMAGMGRNGNLGEGKW